MVRPGRVHRVARLAAPGLGMERHLSIGDDIRRLFEVFSVRHSDRVLDARDEIDHTTRTRLLLVYGKVLRENSYLDPSSFWIQCHNALQIRHGRTLLSNKSTAHGLYSREAVVDDLNYFLNECSTKEFVDFIEIGFQVESRPAEEFVGSSSVIDAVNKILRVGGTPYHLTGFVFESPAWPTTGPPRPSRIVSYPMIAKIEEDVLYRESVAPALEILTAQHYKVPDDEFRAALKHYREGEFAESLAGCGSALESVLKVICTRRKWSYKKSDTLGPLLDNVVPQLGLQAVFAEKFKLLATIRNTYSSSHGGGTTPRAPDRNVVQYMIAATAGTIVFLVSLAEGRGS